MQGHWRSQVFSVPESQTLDLEIGTGNGYHFADFAKKNPESCLLGIELKYKPLVQTIRRCLRQGSENCRMLRYDAGAVAEIFAENEIDDVYIHHPDPWPKKRHLKNRLIQESFLKDLSKVMKPGKILEFKTDHYGYFQWATLCFAKSSFQTVDNICPSSYKLSQILAWTKRDFAHLFG